MPRRLNIPDAEDVVCAELGKVSKRVSKEFTDRESKNHDMDFGSRPVPFSF
jgi:hypothetical protein